MPALWPTYLSPFSQRKRVRELEAKLAEREAELNTAKDRIQELNAILGIGAHTPDFAAWSEQDRQNLQLMQARYQCLEENWVAAKDTLADVFTKFELLEDYARAQIKNGEREIKGIQLQIEKHREAIPGFVEVLKQIGEVFAMPDPTPKAAHPAYAKPFDPVDHPQFASERQAAPERTGEDFDKRHPE